MEEKQKSSKEGKNWKQGIKGIIFLFAKKIILIAAIIILIIILCSGGYYSINQREFNDASNTSQAYSATVNSNGQVVYTTQNENNETVELTPAQMAEEYRDVLQQYISEDDQEYSEIMQYLMGAETVTSMPYIDGRPEGELNGGVKFYRYTDAEEEVNETNVTEEHRLKYLSLEAFNAKMEAYERDAQNNRDIFNYFTIDTDGAVLVAYGNEEYREIHTGPNAAGATDKDLNIDIINERSTFGIPYGGHYVAGFYAKKFTILTKKIDYSSLVEQYKMPDTLLYSFLIQTENLDFVKALAEIAYQSQIAIGIYDNKTHSETNETYTYKKLMDMSVGVDLEYIGRLVYMPPSDETGPAFAFDRDDLYYGDYQYIIESCEAETKNESGTIEHQVTYIEDGRGEAQGWVEHPDKKMYIVTDQNNKIISLGDGETYKTKFSKVKETMSTPTVGVLLADTWIAKWAATYNKENINTPESIVPETAKEDELIVDYGIGVITNAFLDIGGTYEELRLHAEAQVRNAKEQIIQQVIESGILMEDINIPTNSPDRQSVMRDHVRYDNCSTCKTDTDLSCEDYADLRRTR